jgi:putative membrane protein
MGEQNKKMGYELVPYWFMRYKFFNSLFLGLSIGAVFTLYAPIQPSVYSIGGVLLALGMLLVARLYCYILNAAWLYRISLLVELVLSAAILYFLLYPYTYQTALWVYIGYQVTFVFGSYLVRTETLLLQSDTLLTRLDTLKQMGYLVGMGGAYLFYRTLEHYGVTGNQEQVYWLHFGLLALEVVIIALIYKSFLRNTDR